ncbi:MAG: class A beta-lactamase, subclass A2 [Flavipsychrobacter sp.]
MKKIRLIFFILALSSCYDGYAQQGKAEILSTLKHMVDTANGTLGIGVYGLDFKDSIFFNEGHHFPMQSVFKVPLAIAVLHKVDAGSLSLYKKFKIRYADLDENTWSPMIKDLKGNDTNMALHDLLRYAISQSDNNACDILFDIVGGTADVNTYIHDKGIKRMNIAATEAQMKKGWDVQYRNYSTCGAMLHLLDMFYKGKLLKPATNALLMKLMVESENSNDRLKGLLPKDAVVAHKTGTSNLNDKGIRAATNDVGIVTLPNGRHYAIVVFYSDYKGSMSMGERTIANVSKSVWDYYSSL